LAKVNGSGQWQHSNVYALGHIIATYDANGTRFQLDDAQGTRRVQANTDGTAGLSCFSYPYGDGLSCSGPDEDATEEHFTGKEYDPESGNYYFGARYDADNYGRFLTPDWSAVVEPVPYAKLDDPQSLNLYIFVLDNPVSAVDGDGHQCSGHKEQSCKAKNKTKARQKSVIVVLVVQRDVQTSHSTGGRFTLSSSARKSGKVTGYTLEPPARPDPQGNGTTRMPAGTYKAIFLPPGWGHVHAVLRLAVPGHIGVEVHPGNYPHNTHMCVLPGTTRGANFVGHSRQAVNEIRNYINNIKSGDGGKATIEVVVKDPNQ